MYKSALAIAACASLVAATALAQQPAAGGGTTVTSEPGKATITQSAELTGQVVGIDKATRTVTLKGPKGNVLDIVAGDEVKNFDQVKLGDFVTTRYVQALTLELAKTKGGAPVTMREGVARAQPGERPAGIVARQVTVLADVIGVDPKKKTITLKGPKGNIVELEVQNPDHFKVVKKGDQVQATYTEALAMSVEPAPKPAAAAPKKKK